jgi:hypothetical protein
MESKTHISRRNVVWAALGAAPIIALGSQKAEAKMSQTTVAYQQTPKDDKECDQCNFYIDPNACKVVDGEINPKGYCKLWNKKAS